MQRLEITASTLNKKLGTVVFEAGMRDPPCLKGVRQSDRAGSPTICAHTLLTVLLTVLTG